MSSLIQKIEGSGVLANPVKLLSIANTATSALTVDPGLGSVAKLLTMAAGLRNLHSKNVTFITMPTILDPANINRLLPQEPQDDLLWQMLKTGTLWHGSLPAPAPQQVQVAVLNGTGIAGLAGQAAAASRSSGSTWSAWVTRQRPRPPRRSATQVPPRLARRTRSARLSPRPLPPSARAARGPSR